MSDQGTERFTERELALILKRASELQGSEEPSRMRYSLVEIQDIAQGAGIDRDTVAAAAAELRRPAQSTHWLIGGPTRFRADRTADALVPKSAFADVIDTIRAETGLQGEANQVFDTLEWRGRDNTGEVFVTIAPRGEQTRVTVTAARAEEALLAGFVGGGAAIGVFAIVIAAGNGADLPEIVTGTMAIASGAGTMLGVTRLLWQRKVKSWHERANAIAESIAARLSPKSP